MEDKQQISFALGGSVLVHLLLAGGVTTLLAFSRVAPPGNDHFESSMELLAGDAGAVIGDNYYATREIFEPAHAQTFLGGSVWWHWNAGQSGEVEVNVIAQDFKEVVGVYRGAVLETLVEVAVRGTGDQEPVRFSAQQGQSYYVTVAGSAEKEAGRISVDIAILGDDEDEPDDEELVLLLPDMFVVEEAGEKERPADLDYVRTRSRDASERAPENARLESDHSTLAASEVLPGEHGEEDTPNVLGGDLPFGDLVSSEFTDGDFRDEGALPVTVINVPPVEIAPKKPDSPAPDQAAGNPGQPQQEDEEPVADAATQDNLHDIKHEVLADEKASGGDTGSADAGRLINEDKPGEPEVVESNAGKPVTSPVEGEVLPPREGQSPAFQTHSPKKRLAGKLSNIGNPALDVSETPLGHYKKKVDQAVQRSWHRARTARGDFAKFGSLKVRFWVDRSGKIVELKVLRNDADPVMLDFSISGIRNAVLPPVPEELIDRTQDGRMEFDYEIIIY